MSPLVPYIARCIRPKGLQNPPGFPKKYRPSHSTTDTYSVRVGAALVSHFEYMPYSDGTDRRTDGQTYWHQTHVLCPPPCTRPVQYLNYNYRVGHKSDATNSWP